MFSKLYQTHTNYVINRLESTQFHVYNIIVDEEQRFLSYLDEF